MLSRIIALKPPFNACLGAPCGACLIQASYNQWGDVYTCDEGRSCEIFKLGNVKKDSYKKVFSSSEALNFVGLTSCLSAMCDACEWHPYCSPCLVSTYGAQKNLISKIPSDFLCKIRKSQVEYLFKKLIFSDDKKILFDWLS
jgi:radical SAM protein with 4Fe4S-binding SPASM domain